MYKKIYIGFKGKNNASCVLASTISKNYYLLTNSFKGLKKDIERLDDFYDLVIMFGIDKNLKNIVRLEQVAKNKITLHSNIDLNKISKNLIANGIDNFITDEPTHYLCNEAYYLALQKFNGKAVFIHIPSLKNMNNEMMEKLILSLR